MMIMPKFRARLPATTALIYTVCAAAWILLSDLVLDALAVPGSDGWAYMASVKGLLFVAITATILYRLLVGVLTKLERAETDLRTQEKRWRLALETVGDGLWETDLESGQSFYSRKWKSMLGYEEGDIGTAMADWLNLIHPDDRVEVDREMQHYLKGSSPEYRCEYRLRGKDGVYRWILSRGSYVPTADGQPSRRIIGTHTDITERKSNERRIADTLAFAKAVLRSSPLGIIAYGPDGRCAIANESAARIIGTDVAGVLRQNFRDLSSWRQSGLLDAAERVLATGREEVFAGRHVTSFGLELAIEAHLVTFTYDNGRHLLLVLSDETGRQHTQDNLNLMHAAVQAAPIGWVVTDAEGIVQWVNPGFTVLTGYTEAEAVGRHTRVLKSGRHPPEFYADMWQKVKRGEVWSGELFNQRKDGTQYDEQMTIVPVRSPVGTITHFVAIKQDITERKNLELQIARTQRLESVGMLASGIAHDLNNIFAPILLSLELLKLKYPDSDARRMIELIEGAGVRGASIVRQVLTFARGMDGERMGVEPKYLVKELAQMLAETLPRNIAIEAQVAPVLPPVEADATQLHQVLLNLAVNARDAMPGGGRLTLGARAELVDEARAAAHPPLKPGPCVALTVTDTGTGIAPDVMEHMFEPFYTTKPRDKGTGLGLSTVYGIVRSHGGAIEVTSQIGVGTTFTVLLPALGQPAAPAAEAARVRERLEGAGRCLLVVDDEDSIRLITARALERHGFVVETACDGLEALEKFRADPPRFAALVTDLMMPRLGGRELVEQVRRITPKLPVLVSSGLAETDEDKPDSPARPPVFPHTLLRKPYTEDELLRALGEEIARRSAP